MTELSLSLAEPFTSPAWGGNLVVFAGERAIPEDAVKEYLRRACKYARRCEVYLVPERFFLMGYLCLCLISPKGDVLGAQKGLYLNTKTRLGKHSSVMEVFRTEFGGIYLCVDVDIYHPEVARIAAGMGAQFLICSQEMPSEDYNSNMVLTGAWSAAQSAGVYVIDAGSQFNCVCAPIDLTPHEDGFIVSPTLRVPLTAKLDVSLLEKRRPTPRLSRKFYAIHRGDLLR